MIRRSLNLLFGKDGAGNGLVYSVVIQQELKISGTVVIKVQGFGNSSSFIQQLLSEKLNVVRIQDLF